MQYLWLFYGIWLVENLIIRTILLIHEWKPVHESGGIFLNSIKVFLVGAIFDSLNFSFYLPFLAIILWLIPKKWAQYLLTALIILILTFQGHAEWFFWNEFTSRFNFIAVDYLIYTKEVLGNIMESYPMHLVYSSILFFSAILSYLCFKIKLQAAVKLNLKIVLLSFLFPILTYFGLYQIVGEISENQIVNQLAYNGQWQLMHAYFHNELDYDMFYSTKDKKIVESTILNKWQSNLKNEGVIKESKQGLIKMIAPKGEEKKYNVILVGVESLGAKFMAKFGGAKNITPHLDQLISRSLFFSNIYATGTRTIRGLEALTLSIPPTPGYSIVKRPDNGELFSLGKVFYDHQYDNKFIYGGYGYFDNMNVFFQNNFFKIIDRTLFKKEEYVMANIWGVDDESLFNRVLKEADESFSLKQKFFSFVMTTSNHRPFTYPEGRIDIPSHTSREGAVKYTDFAIHKFLMDAQKHPWFHNTIFVIVADHGVGGRGTNEIPMEDYHIPFFIYAPNIIPPKEISTLASQIDVAPTLLAMMNFKYQTKFFGQNILTMNKADERAIMGTYSSLGYYQNGQLVTLGLNRKIDVKKFDESSRQIFNLSPSLINEEVINSAISNYQYASYLWKNKFYKVDTIEK